MISQNQYLLELTSKGIRIDNREANEYRKILIEKDVIEKAEGSAEVKIGKTHVIVGVKLDVGEPFPDKPNEGALLVGAEFSPIASPEFELGPPGEDAIELARVIDRGIRESKAIETEKLCIEEGKKVWMVYVDINILDNFGNLIDASALASIVALLNTKIPGYAQDKIIHTKKTKKLPVKYKPIACTFTKIGEKIFLDPNLEEEKVTNARLTITTKDDGNICALQKGGVGKFSLEEIDNSLELAVKKGNELRKLL